MNFLVQWGKNPWGEDILTHAQFGLLYLALAFGVCFMIGHTLFVKFWPKPAGPPIPPPSPVSEAQAAKIGFSAYAISADMNDPIVQAIHSLLDHAASTDGRLQMLIDRLQTEGVDCGDAKATAERFDPTQINKMLE